MKFSNIRLLVNDFDSAFAFYNDTLGWECTWGKPGENFASFSAGTESVLCIFKAELMPAAIYAAAKPGAVVCDKTAIVIEVGSVDETFQKLRQKEVVFMTEPKDMPAWGIRVAHFRDTENNLLEIYASLP